MTLSEIKFLFNRAWSHTFSLKKFYLSFPVILLVGFISLFCLAFTNKQGGLISSSLIFLPIFLSLGIVLALGVVLSRIYYKEVKKNEVSYSSIIAKSTQVLVGALLLSVPSILVFVSLIVIMGVFSLIGNIPTVGEAFHVIFGFAPFLVVLTLLLLSVLSLLILFFLSPTVALKTGSPLDIAKNVYQKFIKDPFTNIILFMIGIIPALFVLTLILIAASLSNVHRVDNALYFLMQWIFMMVPTALIMTAPILFFFNFATESYAFKLRVSKI